MVDVMDIREDTDTYSDKWKLLFDHFYYIQTWQKIVYLISVIVDALLLSSYESPTPVTVDCAMGTTIHVQLPCVQLTNKSHVSSNHYITFLHQTV